MPDIYEPHFNHFGDSLISINYCLHLSVIQGKPIHMHCRNEKMKAIYDEILGVIDCPKGQIILTDEPPNKKFTSLAMWYLPRWPTKQTWKWEERHKFIAVQFDGRSAPQKLATAEQEQQIIDYAKSKFPGRPVVRLGKELGLELSIQAAVKSICFIGICSGMSHLMHAVGTPTFLLEFGLPLEQVHQGKAYWHCSGVSGFKNWFGWFHKGLEGIKHPDIAI